MSERSTVSSPFVLATAMQPGSGPPRKSQLRAGPQNVAGYPGGPGKQGLAEIPAAAEAFLTLLAVGHSNELAIRALLRPSWSTGRRPSKADARGEDTSFRDA